jgi:ubiquinone/menaquinone biosynthesis C-methylase UbiE/glycosyltransferase involved in cell wall biosynthesis
VDAGNNRPMRAMNLANMLVARGHQVVLWSADFDHINKRFRNLAGRSIEVESNLEIRLLPSSGYQCNIGLRRLIDHASLGINLKKRLRSESSLPDVAFIGYPPIETAYVLTRWCRARGVPILLDIKDQWPVIFNNALPRLLRPPGRVLLYPYTFLAKRAMRSASAISAMAEGFLDWALGYCGRSRSDLDRVYPLTTPVGRVDTTELGQALDWWQRQGLLDPECQRVYFAGSFSSAFDFAPVRAAAQEAVNNGEKLKFVLCGDGSAIEQVKTAMAGLDNVVFPGWVDRPRIEALAQHSIASIAPYKNSPDFMLSIPNKIIDSLALGRPVLTPLKGEVAALIDAHRVGISYDDQPEACDNSLYRSIKRLVDDSDLQNSMSRNARELYNARFLFERVYGDLASQLEQMAELSTGVSSDKDLEHERYEQRARAALSEGQNLESDYELTVLPAALSAPYEAYTAEISAAVDNAETRVLEIGAGTGMYTETILQTGARVTATDISESALEILQRRMAQYGNFETRVADMEALPFADGAFDLVVSAGSLSYGDNQIVMDEIYRVLDSGGKFICVDSLNHSPIYRLNRWIQYLRGLRTRSTIERMPTQALVRQYGQKFGQVRSQYFGSITWSMPLLKIFLADETFARISARIDRLVGVSKSAFKLVMVADKKS